MSADDAEATEPQAGPPEEGETRYNCYDCGQRFHVGDHDGTIECPACGLTLDAYQALLFTMSNNAAVRRLASGPKTTSEVPRSSTGSARAVVEFLSAPTSTTGGRVHTGSKKDIIYLPGDERAAVRLFIEENTEYVRETLKVSPNPLQLSWDDLSYQLLIEQWYWSGHAEVDDEDADGDASSGEELESVPSEEHE